MKCKDVERNIDSYCAGYLPEDFAQAVEDHLSNCPVCSLNLLGQDSDFDSLLTQTWYECTPSSDFAQGVMSRVSAPSPSPSPYLWIIPLWGFYMTIWGALGLWLFTGSRMQAMLRPAITAGRAALVVLQTLGDVLSLVQVSEFGALLVFLMSLILFTGMGLLGKEVKQ